MTRSDIYLAIAVILAAIFIGGLAEYGLKIGIPGCPIVTATVTPAQHDADSTPNLPLIVTVRPSKKPVEAIKHSDTLPDTVPVIINLSPVSAPTAADSAPVATYSTFKRFPDGDSVHISASSKILPLTPPNDWSWTVDRFTRPDTTAVTLTTAKQRHFGFGMTIGAGLTTDNLTQKSYVPKLSLTVGYSWMY